MLQNLQNLGFLMILQNSSVSEGLRPGAPMSCYLAEPQIPQSKFCVRPCTEYIHIYLLINNLFFSFNTKIFLDFYKGPLPKRNTAPGFWRQENPWNCKVGQLPHSTLHPILLKVQSSAAHPFLYYLRFIHKHQKYRHQLPKLNWKVVYM